LAIVLGVRELAAAERQWMKLLAPIRPNGGVWDLGAGPAIHLVADDEDRVVMLRIKVKSLERVRTFLEREHLLGQSWEREISMNRSRVSGADIRFVE
jgi:hypothetical protein